MTITSRNLGNFKVIHCSDNALKEHQSYIVFKKISIANDGLITMYLLQTMALTVQCIIQCNLVFTNVVLMTYLGLTLSCTCTNSKYTSTGTRI